MTYAIAAGYVTRWPVAPHDPFTADERYQEVVYERAARLLREIGGTKALDWGCGSAVKTARYFMPGEVVGVELPEIAANAARRFPHHAITDASAPWLADWHPDVLLSADVIEHVEDPLAFLETLRAFRPRWLVLSTPAKEHIGGITSMTGPPINPTHAREWTMAEFAAFLTGAGIVISEHTLIDPPRSTQCVVGYFG